MLTEIWLTTDFSYVALGCIGYQIYQSDRDQIATDKTCGGGILCAVLSSLQAERIEIHRGKLMNNYGSGCPLKTGKLTTKHTVMILKDYIYPNDLFVIAGDYALSNFGIHTDLDVNIFLANTNVNKQIFDIMLLTGLLQDNTNVPNAFNVNLDLVLSNCECITVNGI